ncbi:MAG: 23S rRNA (adenine(2503)-C(2))-methyltransferase RlmN, partial [Candidatus Coatesbacteria bacterium]|nr:23S rRNA (adenine(2503)-C(2))-methyltransferase RlmN [Candidatus Coatesbacteria bacterium]
TRRLPTFEYILIDGLNSEISHAEALAYLLKRVRCKVNLIPFNRTCHTEFMPPSSNKATRFLTALENSGIKATIRHSKGGEIAAACGQLVNRRAEEMKDQDY